jgi:hypothetical protein
MGQRKRVRRDSSVQDVSGEKCFAKWFKTFHSGNFLRFSANKSLIRTLLGIEEMLMGTGKRPRAHERTHSLDCTIVLGWCITRTRVLGCKNINDMGLWREQRA